MALSANPTVKELKELAENYPDLEVTRLDSLMTGNCGEGTDDFIENCLDGQTTAKVSQLFQYLDGFPGVRSVLEYKFRQLEGPVEESAKPEEEQSEEETEDVNPF